MYCKVERESPVRVMCSQANEEDTCSGSDYSGEYSCGEMSSSSTAIDYKKTLLLSETKSKKHKSTNNNALPASKRKRLAANARERKRMHLLNKAFEDLRIRLGDRDDVKRMSKWDILCQAHDYIRHLTKILNEECTTTTTTPTITTTQTTTTTITTPTSTPTSTPISTPTRTMVGQQTTNDNSHQSILDISYAPCTPPTPITPLTTQFTPFTTQFTPSAPPTPPTPTAHHHQQQHYTTFTTFTPSSPSYVLSRS